MADLKIEIETGVPVPARYSGQGFRGRPPKYPFLDLLVGQSFFLMGQAGERAGQAAYQAAARSKGKLKFRLVKMDGGTRIWRVL